MGAVYMIPHEHATVSIYTRILDSVTDRNSIRLIIDSVQIALVGRGPLSQTDIKATRSEIRRSESARLRNRGKVPKTVESTEPVQSQVP